MLSNSNRASFPAAGSLNRTSGQRFTAGGQLSRQAGNHLLIAALEHESEDFRARDQIYFGGTDQDRSRSLTALVGEWRADWSSVVSTDLALRHDGFSAFADAASFRGSVILRPASGWQIHTAYGEGIAQPTFYDLFGFFPGSFRGNPDLRPERSRGIEAGLRWAGNNVALGITGFANRLRDEIVPTYDPATFLSGTANAAGRSRRRGVELEASYRPSPVLLITANYTHVDADEAQVVGGAAVREIRRPRHSANLVASGASGRFSWSTSAAYVGARTDTDFDPFPSRLVRLDDYLLGSLRLGWKLTPQLEAYARAENAFDDRYRDVVGYRTPGRTVYAGIRLRLGD